jgi:CheY-like chemotaxis protein
MARRSAIVSPQNDTATVVSGPLEGLHILFVDNSPDDLEAYSSALAGQGATVATATDVVEALEVFERERPEIVISGEDGAGIVTHVRAKPVELGGRTPIVALTAGAGMPERDGALAAGFTEHLAKPFRAEDLVRLVAGLERQIAETRALCERVRRPASDRAHVRESARSRTPGLERTRHLRTHARDLPAPEPEARSAFGNRLLDSLPPGEREWVAARSRYVGVERGQTLYAAGTRLGVAFFPRGAVLSLVCVAESGKCVEVVGVGAEGFVGVPLVLGTQSSPHWVRVTVEGGVWRMLAADLALGLGECPALREALMRSAQAQFVEVSQSATCNRLHSIERQVARWLLATCARCGSASLDVTHDAIAELLGTRRASVSVAIESFVGGGLVESGRGRVRVVDHRGLAAVACECYGVVRGELEAMYPGPMS